MCTLGETSVSFQPASGNQWW